RQRWLDDAVDAAQQAESVLGRAERLQQVRKRGQLFECADVARSERLRRSLSDARAAGYLRVAAQQQGARRGWVWILLLTMGRPCERESEHRVAREGRRAVCRRLSAERKHPAAA